MLADAKRPATTTVRCPKCRSKDIDLIEVGEWTTLWRVRGGMLDREEGLHDPGDINHVEAKCVCCGRHWRVRRAGQIDDVVAELPDDTVDK